MRLSSFLPMNMPISFGFIMAAPTPFNTILWQWINQTYNATLNYGNRNASSQYTMQDIAKSYGMACGASIALALGVRKAMNPLSKGVTGAKLLVLNTAGSFIGCSTAGFLNAWFMRQTELEKGIDVLDPETMESYGKSQICAKQAVV